MAASLMIKLGALCCATLVLPASLAIAALVDPTRPPGTAETFASDAGNGPVLQSILISNRRREATISGRLVKVGDTVGDAKVVRITETEVHLRRGSSVERLMLFPEVQKKLTPSKLPVSAGGANR